MTDKQDFLDTFIEITPLGVIAVNAIGEVLKLNQKAMNLLNVLHKVNALEKANVFDFFASMPDCVEDLENVLKNKSQSFDFAVCNFGGKSLQFRGNWIKDTFVIFIDDLSKFKNIDK